MLHYAQSAWSIVANPGEDIATALQALWKFIGSVHILLAHIFAVVDRAVHSRHLTLSGLLLALAGDLLDALVRLKDWIWSHQVNPVRAHLSDRIGKLRRWTAAMLALEQRYAVSLYFLSLHYAWRQFTVERKARLAEVKAARAYSVKLTKAALATVQREAADGYNADRGQRESLIVRIADEIVNRNPELKGIVGDLVKFLIDALEIDDPLIRVLLNGVLIKVVDSLGIDKIMGNLLSDLIRQVTHGGKPATLQHVIADIAGRLDTLEAQQAQFMEHGGPEVEQAGDLWKSLRTIGFDIAIVGFFAQAATAPQAWATEVADTVGVVVGDTVSAVTSLLVKA
jgi:hypothetical protein